MKTCAFAVLALAAALAITPAAKADSFNFYFSDDTSVSGSGTLTGTDEGGGEWLITSATGTFDDGTNSGSISLIPIPPPPSPGGIAGDAYTSPSGFFTYDDLLFPSAGPFEVLDFNGLLFSFDGMELNLWEGGFPPVDGWAEETGSSGSGSFTLTPEPGTVLPMTTGLLVLAGILLRRSRLCAA